jgi:hypothetical protein
VNETGYFTVTATGKRQHRFSFEAAAYAAYHHGEIERVIEVERVLVNGAQRLRERDVTERAIDFLSTI